MPQRIRDVERHGLVGVEGMIFGTYCVLVNAARPHAMAWKAVLDQFLRSRAAVLGIPYTPFVVPGDYLRFLYDRPPIEGLAAFLATREIWLDYDALRGLSAREEEYFIGQVRTRGVASHGSTAAVLRRLRKGGIRTAVVSTSRNLDEVLTRAGICDLLDGYVTSGGPLAAAERLGTPPARAALAEGSPTRVAAGARAGFGLVIGVAHWSDPAALRAQGAHIVVADLSELPINGRSAA